MFNRAKKSGKAASKKFGPSSAAVIAAIIAAGATTGYLARTAMGTAPEQTGYCLYFTGAAIPPGCTALHTCTFGVGNSYYAVPNFSNAPCDTHNVVVCGLTLQFLGHSSTPCPSP